MVHTDTEAESCQPETPDDTGPRCLGVMYHYIRDGRSCELDGVVGLTTAQFQRQLDRLCAVAEPTDWASCYAWLQGRGSIPDRAFLLTFDDGLADHAHVVAPILRDRGLRGVFFVSGDTLVAQRLLPAHATHLLLATVGTEAFDQLLAEWLARHAGDVDWRDSVDLEAAHRVYHYESPERARLKYLLSATLPQDLRDRALTALFEEHVGTPSRWAQHWYLNWDDLVAMEAMGHTIGGHGQCHESYERMTGDAVRRDIQSIAAVLSGGLGPDLRPFSYPYGSATDEARSACAHAGFVQAFTTHEAWITGSCDPLRLPRVDTIHVDAMVEEVAGCQQAP